MVGLHDQVKQTFRLSVAYKCTLVAIRLIALGPRKISAKALVGLQFNASRTTISF